MADLISRKRLLNVLRNTPDIAGLGLEPVIATQTAIELIEIAPAVDAVPVTWLRNLCAIAKMETDDEMFIDWLIQTWQEEQEAR